ncbi:MAG TPA: DPP IV N-terminal domain-containing protein [Bryobacteraceae bacterium]|nr:DPP IV N-terminal domain-containing protein [Bryobacteraceae bacterium]
MHYALKLGRRDWARIAVVSLGLLVLLAVSFPGSGADDPPSNLPAKATKANYELAARWTASKVGKLVFDMAVTPHWLEDGSRFWYTFENNAGRKFYIVDPAKKTKTYVFDAVKVAASLTTATGLPYDSQHLPIGAGGGGRGAAGGGGAGGRGGGVTLPIQFVKHDTAIQFDISVPRDAVIPGEKKTSTTAASTEAQGNGGDADASDPQQAAGRGAGAASTTKQLTFEYELASGKLTLLDERPPRKPTWASVSPDGKTIVFARNYNLYMMDEENYAKALKNANDTTIVETQLTKDGEEYFGYGGRGGGGQQIEQQQQENQGEQGEGQASRARTGANVTWSKDSKKFAVGRQDQRKVKPLWVINSLANPRPTLETYKYAMPGDPDYPQAHLEVFDVASKARSEMKADAGGFKDQRIRIESDPATAYNREHEKAESTWSGAGGSDKLYFSRLSRDEHRLDVCVADTATGEVKPLIQERMNVYIEEKPLKFLNNGAEMLWWSERDGWGHYYLYGADGTLKSQVDHGEYVAEDISSVDDKARTFLMTASGREDGENPYFMHNYRVNLDGSGTKLLDPGDASHAVVVADNGKYFVDNSSRVNTAPQSVLYDAQGTAVMPLEKVDLGPLMAEGYKFPEPFMVKADDGITDIYGVMYKPFDFDPNRKYPIIEFVYPGPQTESVTQTFSPRSNNIALANLGFIVIEVGNRGGNPHRSKWYHTYGYGNLRDYGLADKKAAVEQLAARYPWIDIDRVGITGHSGGGFMSTAAMLVYPDFFKVAVSESGNHENNIYNAPWSEKHHGVKEVTDKDGKVTFEYTIDKNSEIAKNLKGHLLISTGDVDNNVHPGNTLRLADALIKANKRFDFVILPGQQHSYGTEAEYFSWIRADYFCKYLLGDFDQSVDMWELNRERPQGEHVPPPGATTGRGTTQQQQQQNGRGGRGGRGGQ